MNVWKKTTEFIAGLKRNNKPPEPPPEEEITVPCCSEEVHIAFRGVSDEKLYMAYNRKWSEVKFYRPNGLKVFCSTCRARLY